MPAQQKHTQPDAGFNLMASTRLHLLLQFCLLLNVLPSHATVPLSLPRPAITAQELGVIIAAGDPNSEAIGSYYQLARGVPAANVVRVPITTGVDELSATDFAAIKASIDAKLPASVQATVLTWTRPFAVRKDCRISITTALARPLPASFCAHMSSEYFDSDSGAPYTDFGIRPSMMLGVSTLAAAQTLVQRGIAADGSYPVGTGYLIRTSDANRSVRWPVFASLPAPWSAPGGLTLNYIDNSTGAKADYITGKTGVLFYFSGLSTLPALTTNTYLPGGVGDHLTSYGGDLSGTKGQTMATAWLDAGMTGSYGTVDEPFAVTSRFPNAGILLDRYYRGNTLIEAYWKSVSNTSLGLFLGEPLSKPFPNPASATIQNGQYMVQTRFSKIGEYAVEYQNGNTTTWTHWTKIDIARLGTVSFTTPVVPETAAVARLAGPCGQNISILAEQTTAKLLGLMTAHLALKISNAGPCVETISLAATRSAGNGDILGLTTAFNPESLSLQAYSTATVDMQINVPENFDIDNLQPTSYALTLTRAGQSTPLAISPLTITAVLSEGAVPLPAWAIVLLATLLAAIGNRTRAI